MSAKAPKGPGDESASTDKLAQPGTLLRISLLLLL